jgi:hypothetical protein
VTAIAKSLAETLREKTAPIVIRRKGARGELPVSAQEKIDILVHLTQDPELEISLLAMETLSQTGQDELLAVLKNPDTPASILDFAADHLVEDKDELLDALLHHPAYHHEASKPESDAAEAVETATIESESDPPDSAGQPGATSAKQSLLQKLSKLSPAGKIKRALMGSREERLILIRDSNKSVARAVVQSPKLTDSEVEAIASMRNVTDEVLRVLAQNRAHLKHYTVVRALVGNPKAPIDIALPLINHLNDRDLKIVALDRNLPEVIRTVAAKNLRDRQATRGPGTPRKH